MLHGLTHSRVRSLGLLSFVVLGLAVGPAAIEAQGNALHRVVISVNTVTGALSFSIDPVITEPGDRVMFEGIGVDTWAVTFQGDTPFAGRVIQARGNESRTVPILPNAAAGTYKYDASVTVGGQVFSRDPEIVVRGRGEQEKPDPS